MIWEEPIDSIKVEDVETLISAQVMESRKLDYKEKLPGKADADKKEFLADVASFANSGGGVIIFGVKDVRDKNNRPTGAPQLVGLDSALNKDAEMLRLQGIIQSGISPRVPVGLRFISLSEAKFVLIARIPSSWAAPHMVAFDGNQKFFARNSSGKYPLDVLEIRRAFVESETLNKRVDEFVYSRFAKISADDTPVKLAGGPRLTVHLIPIPAFLQQRPIDLKALQFNEWQKLVPSTVHLPLGYRYNFDGFVVTLGRSGSDDNLAYTQIFRNGSIEFVYAFDPKTREERPRILHLTSLENRIVENVRRFLGYYTSNHMDAPIEVRVSLEGVRGYFFESSDIMTGGHRSSEIEKNELLVPGVLFEEFSQDAATQLRPAFDVVWNACGEIGSPNYDANGRRNPQRN